MTSSNVGTIKYINAPSYFVLIHVFVFGNFSTRHRKKTDVGWINFIVSTWLFLTAALLFHLSIIASWAKEIHHVHGFYILNIIITIVFVGRANRSATKLLSHLSFFLNIFIKRNRCHLCLPD